MKASRESLLSKKYAQAFLNSYLHTLSPQDIEQAEILKQLFSTQKDLVTYLSLSFIPTHTRLAYLEKILDAQHVPVIMRSLIESIVKSNRSALLADTFDFIQRLYNDAMNILPCSIASSQPLSCEDLDALHTFLTQRTKKNITYKVIIDKELIAGIRITSETFLWEFSLQKQLKNISLSIIR